MPFTADEVERNYAAFQASMPTIIAEHRGQFALLHAETIEGFFARALDAVREGVQRFGWDRFSVQEVTDAIENLGFYSYAGGGMQA